MNLIEASRAQLEPLTHAVIQAFDADADPEAVGFFTAILVHLSLMEAEEDLANVFFELSSTAFRGFSFSPEQGALIDELLLSAEEIAFAMSAPADDAQ